MAPDTLVHTTYEFPQVRRFLDRRGVAYRVAPGSPRGSDLGCDHWVVRFERAEDARAFRAEYPNLLLPEHQVPVPALSAADVAAAA